MLACMLWHDVQGRWQALKAQGESAFPALQKAIDAVFDARIGDISGRGRLAADMRETWMMQPRLERRVPAAAFALIEQPRFRAGLDFLRLRGEAGEIDPELARWWEGFAHAGDARRHELLEQARARESTRRAAEPMLVGNGDAAPARKRRRRRRRPAGDESPVAQAQEADAPRSE